MDGLKQRKYWVETLIKIAEPVLTSASERKFKGKMPVERKKGDRELFTHLECVGRTLSGLFSLA